MDLPPGNSKDIQDRRGERKKIALYGRQPTEEDPEFDPRFHGNRQYGPGARFPKAPKGTKFSSRAESVSRSKERTAPYGTGPGPKGSYPKVQTVSKKAILNRLGR